MKVSLWAEIRRLHEVERLTVTLRANATEVWIVDQGREVARHPRFYEKGQLVRRPEDHLAALKLRRRRQAGQFEEEFDALGPLAREFHLKLLSMPVKPTVHLRRLLGLVRLYRLRERHLGPLYPRRGHDQRAHHGADQRHAG